MINGTIEQFLDTGWYSEATLFYNGRIYWFEGNTDFETGITKFVVNSWKAKNYDDKYFGSYIDEETKDVAEYRQDFIAKNSDMDWIKKEFLTAKIFEGKSFWEVEPELVWLDEGEPIQGVEN